MPLRNEIDLHKEEITNLLSLGMSWKDIAEKTGFSASALRRWGKEKGITQTGIKEKKGEEFKAARNSLTIDEKIQLGANDMAYVSVRAAVILEEIIVKVGELLETASSMKELQVAAIAVQKSWETIARINGIPLSASPTESTEEIMKILAERFPV